MRTKRNLILEEHYILQNIGSFVFQYLLLWAVALGLAFLAGMYVDVECDPTVTKAFSISTTTLSVTTITFALPTCMRTIFAAYEDYHSTTIRTILMMRFPITLLSLSAFTSLVVSMSVASGIVGMYLVLPAWSVLAVVLFWALVCVFYLFCAIEKLVHFVVKAPGAVLDKLEFNIHEVRELTTDDDYREFRQNLASMSDVAATIVRKSTGKDAIISGYLERLREIHRIYATNSVTPTSKETRRLSRKACYACGKELTKLYREAASNNNGDATRAILKSYCHTLSDCIEVGVSRNYLTEMISQVQRFQSYSQTSKVPEIKEQASVTWFFMLLPVLRDAETTNVELMNYAKHCVVRELLMTLRRATLKKDEETLVVFMRLASNSDLDLSLDLRSQEWLALLDRTVMLYLNWLLVAQPEDAAEYLGLLRRYSLSDQGDLRPLFCNTVNRFKELLKLERFDDKMGARSADFLKKEVGTAALMDLPLGIDATRFLSYLVEMTYIDAANSEIFQEVPDFKTVCDHVTSSLRDEQGYDEALDLAALACPNPDSLEVRFFGNQA